MAPSPRIQLLERAMSVLGMFSPESPTLSLSEIAEELDLYPSTAHRLLGTLESGRFLIRDQETNRYRLGTRLLELAGQVMGHNDVRRLAQPHIRALGHEFGESVSLGYYDFGDMVYVDVFPGLHPFHMSVRIGTRHPAHCVASGRSMLAHLPDEVDRLLKAGLPACGTRAAVAPASFRRELDTSRKRGYALDHGEFIEGVHAAAAAILAPDGTALAALSLIAPSGRSSKTQLTAIGKRLRAVADEIAAEAHQSTALPE